MFAQAIIPGPLSRANYAAHLILGAAVGGVVAFTAFELGFITGVGGSWVRPEGDLNGYLVAWHYFIGDAWRWPLFEVPHMGYPEGSNVVFSDVLPLTALATKALHTVVGVAVMPYGWWILLTYVLQGTMAARLVCACGAHSRWVSIGAATLAVCNIPFMWRVGHTALSSHFVIIWALAVYFESARRGRLRAIEISVLLTVTIMVNAYLFAMVAALTAATVIALWQQRQLRWSDIRRLGVGFLVVAAVATVEGYGVLLWQPEAMRSHGLGVFSWNLVTLLVPPESLWGFPRGVVRDATGGQHEGETYIGLGAVLMLVTATAIGPRTLLALARRHAVLVATLAILALAAASNRVYVANVLLVEYDVPRFVESVGSGFRGTARFIWPLAYVLMVVPVALVFRQLRPVLAVPLIIVVMAVQVKEVGPTVQTLRLLSARPIDDLIDSARWSTWLTRHDRLWQYPSWVCGGLVRSRVWLSPEANRELQIQLLGARLNRPTNSVYTSRTFKDCAREHEWALRPQFEHRVLYLLGSDAVASSPALRALASSESCVNLTWAFACSNSWRGETR